MAELTLLWPWRRRVPFVAQMERTDCAAACLAMILRRFGKHVALSAVREACGIGRDGASASAIVAAARQFGLEVQAYRTGAQALSGLSTPAILHVDGDHFVVLEDTSDDHVRVIDPRDGRERWSREQAARRIGGVALTFQTGPRFTTARAQYPTLRRYLSSLRHCRAAVLMVFACATLMEIAALVFPASTQVVIDHVIKPQRDAWLVPLALVVCAAVVIQLILTFLRDRVIQLLHVTLDVSLMGGFTAHLLRLPLSTLQQRSCGDLMQTVQANIDLRNLSSKLTSAVLDALLVVAYGRLMLAYHAGLGALVLTLHGARLLLTRSTRRAQGEAIGREMSWRGRERGAAVEAFSATEMVRAFGLGALLTDRFVDYASKRLNAMLERTASGERVARTMQVFDGIGLALLLWCAGRAVLAETLTLGEFAGFLALHSLLGRPLQSVTGVLTLFPILRASVERIDDVFTTPTERSGRKVLDHMQGRIDLQGVHFRYHLRGADVLSAIDLAIAPGQKVAIVGRSGAGKSTLAKLILGLHRPTQGQLLIDDCDIDALDLGGLRRRMGTVLQEPFIFNDTVRANLHLSDEAVPAQRLRSVCVAACIEETIEQLEHGYDTSLGPHGTRLSGGQRQRLSIARALAGRPAILVLDEATSHLDPATEATLQGYLEQLQCTQIIIAHRLATVRRADRIVVLDRGRIAQHGTFEQLARAPGIFRDLVRAGETPCAQ